jgi:hypothetical protein
MDNEYEIDETLPSLWTQRIIDQYRIYFDKETGALQSITNELSDNGYATIEVEFKDVERFLSGRDNLVFYRVEIDDEGAVKFVNKKESPVVFKSNIIEYIRVVDNNTATLQVTWTPTAWHFNINETFLANPRSKSLNSKINFFITKENNINILIRNIQIQIKDLVNKKPCIVTFETEEEVNIDNIAMFTLPFFESYGMTVNYGTN